MNLDEANALMARRSQGPFKDAVEAARALVAAGAANAIVTRGASGVVIADAASLQTIPAVTAQPVEITGAGDAMIAATLHALLSGASVAGRRAHWHAAWCLDHGMRCKRSSRNSLPPLHGSEHAPADAG